MSFDPDSLDFELTETNLLIAILVELKKLNMMVSEATELNVTDEDVE